MAHKKRPPVITIMGHVDHGKTSLLDYIRKTRVTAREAGGITQHIGAYQVDFNGNPLTFIDTPGHAAFNKMRERGADITDLIVLVVAANDGVKPQTIESIRHIKRSGAAFIVAINKIDLPDVDLNIAKSQLAEHDVVVQEYGGDVDVVEISAKTGKGVDTLLENLVVMSDLLELKADDEASLKAVVIESTKDDKRGPVASVIVQQGTLAVRQDLFSDDGIEGRVRALTDENGKQQDTIKPGSPTEIVGLKDVPAVGTVIKEVGAEYEEVATETEDVDDGETDPFADIDFDAAFDDREKIKLLIKADVEGTLEVIHQNIDEDQVDVIDSGVGLVTERDLEMAETSGAAIIAFHTKVPKKLKAIAKQKKIKIRSYDVIYKLIEDLQKQMLKLMDSSIDEVETGVAEILQIFEMKGERIAGSRVKTGEIKKTDQVHLKRGDEIITDPRIKSMMHGKEEINQVTAKSEFGVTFHNKKLDFQVGDLLVAYYNEDDD